MTPGSSEPAKKIGTSRAKAVPPVWEVRDAEAGEQMFVALKKPSDA
jgi:hypothetical protein